MVTLRSLEDRQLSGDVEIVRASPQPCLDQGKCRLRKGPCRIHDNRGLAQRRVDSERLIEPERKPSIAELPPERIKALRAAPSQDCLDAEIPGSRGDQPAAMACGAIYQYRRLGHLPVPLSRCGFAAYLATRLLRCRGRSRYTAPPAGQGEPRWISLAQCRQLSGEM